MDMPAATIVDEEQSSGVKDDNETVFVDDEKLVFNNNEGEAVFMKKTKLTDKDYLSAPNLVGNENAFEAQVDQLTCTEEQVLTVS
ncbi:unnamed protein product [Calypogeia fissa]